MATSNQIIAASSDKDLEQRFVAIAAVKGIENPRYWVQDRMMQLANVIVADGQTVADVYAYADTVHKQRTAELQAELAELENPGKDLADTVRKQRTAELQAELAKLENPGKDLAAVTDTYLATAIDALTTPAP